ncbi:MAG: hypothetical protein Q9170_000346 [Blastenia crenularia]
MVYYFTSNVCEAQATIYVGKDKFENEELIKHGWDEDVWYRLPPADNFHADNLSSAHVYLRLKPGQEWDKLPAALVEDCAQLTKANSIEGNKKENVTVIYTPWANLLKNASMATGQVSFRDPKKTRTILVPSRLNAIVNRLMKTRTLASADGLFAEKEQHLSELRAKAREKAKEARKEEEKLKKERRDEKYAREHAYEDLMQGGDDEGAGGKRSNQEGWDEDDFINLTFDPWKGFKGEIYILVGSGEEVIDKVPPSLIGYYSPVFWMNGVDAVRAFADRMLVIRDQAGNIVPIEDRNAIEGGSQDYGTCWLRGSRVDEYPLLNDSSRALQRSGSSYTLALADPAFVMKGRFMDSNDQPLRPDGNGHLMSVPCADTRIAYNVLAAAPDSLSAFRISFTLTSLSRTPVEIPLSELCGLWYQLHLETLDVRPPMVWNDKSGRLVCPPGQPGCCICEPGAGTTTHEGKVKFVHYGTWTDSRNLEGLIHDPPNYTCYLGLKLGVGSCRLQNWNYSSAYTSINADESAKWPSKGFIELEPVLHGWDKVEGMLESQRPMPFFKLPQEIRDIVYDHIKLADNVGEVQFTFIPTRTNVQHAP